MIDSVNYSIYTTCEYATTISFGDSMDEAINQKVQALFLQLKRNSLWLDVIPAYTTVTVLYDVSVIRKKHPSIATFVRTELEKALQQVENYQPEISRSLTIPVCYHPSFAPDLDRICHERKLERNDFIALHAQASYRVYMIGFLPGFPYMGNVHPSLVLPRLEKPRTNVIAGSVGIAGEQTGIYPLDSPGGWNIIGRTPVKIFDTLRQDPVFFRPGDLVSFLPISKEQFEDFDENEFLNSL
jgi:inhibitor of KinA